MCDKCDGKSWDEIHKKTIHDIMEHGHQVLAVPDGDPPFAYSIGRSLWDKPEFMVIGPLNYRIMQHMINTAAKIAETEPVKDGYVFEPNTLLGDYPVRVVEVEPARTQCFQAIYFNEQREASSPLRILQLVWPDKQGNFPDEPGYDERFEQPIYAVEKA